MSINKNKTEKNMTTYNYKGTTTPQDHVQVVMLGRQFGLQYIRNMRTGDKIAELANGGNKRAVAVCENNPKYFTKA